MRLVHVDIEAAESEADDRALWEVTAPSGCVLRVLQRLEGDDARAVVEAFVSTAVRS